MSTDGNADYRALFTEMVRKPDEDIELDRAALYLAGEEYPAIDVPSLLAELDAFASQIAFRIDPGVATADLAGSIAGYLFNDVGFHGNTGEYYSPDNSFLNRVLETRTGIPITLSLLFMEVGRRLGLKCSGVGLPGHFIVGIDDTGEYLDPFHAGVSLSVTDCSDLVDSMSGGRLAWTDDFLAPVSKHNILFRMLNNLKSVYMQTGAYSKAVGVIQRQSIMSPAIPSLYQEQAWCHAEQQEYRLAIRVLESYLEIAKNQGTGDPEDTKQVQDQINGLWTTLNRLN